MQFVNNVFCTKTCMDKCFSELRSKNKDLASVFTSEDRYSISTALFA